MENKDSKGVIITEEQLHMIYNHPTRGMIVQLLNMYNELSLSQIAALLRKKKTTVQYHVSELKKHSIIRESRNSYEDSRGSIPTKYFSLNFIKLDYHLNFDELTIIPDVSERIITYRNFLLSIKSSIVNLQNKLSYAKTGVESSLKKLEELSKQPKITEESFNELNNFIIRHSAAISTFSTAKTPYREIIPLIPELMDKVKKLEKEYYETERARLIALGKTEDEVEDLFQTDEDYSDGYQLITILNPLKNLLEVALEENKK